LYDFILGISFVTVCIHIHCLLSQATTCVVGLHCILETATLFCSVSVDILILMTQYDDILFCRQMRGHFM